MGQIVLETESKKSPKNAEAATNTATQQNKTNSKTAVDSSILIPEKELKNTNNELSCHIRFFIFLVLMITLVGVGLLIYVHMNFFCTGLLEFEGVSEKLQKKHEELQKSYDDLKSQFDAVNAQNDALMKRTAVCASKIINLVSSVSGLYGEDKVLAMMDGFAEEIQEAEK